MSLSCLFFTVHEGRWYFQLVCQSTRGTSVSGLRSYLGDRTGQGVSPTSQDRVYLGGTSPPPQTGEQVMLRQERCASCGHAGGLSWFFFWRSVVLKSLVNLMWTTDNSPTSALSKRFKDQETWATLAHKVLHLSNELNLDDTNIDILAPIQAEFFSLGVNYCRRLG